MKLRNECNAGQAVRSPARMRDTRASCSVRVNRGMTGPPMRRPERRMIGTHRTIRSRAKKITLRQCHGGLRRARRLIWMQWACPDQRVRPWCIRARWAAIWSTTHAPHSAPPASAQLCVSTSPDTPASSSRTTFTSFLKPRPPQLHCRTPRGVESSECTRQDSRSQTTSQEVTSSQEEARR